MTDNPILAPKKQDRVHGQKYIFKNQVRIWNVGSTGNASWHCEHNRQQNLCKDCGGATICEHNRQRNQCRDCGGATICEHNRQRNQCKDCGGSSICEHGLVQQWCKNCEGGRICEHSRQIRSCKTCSPETYVVALLRARIHAAFRVKSIKKRNRTMELTGCSPKELIIHLESQFTEGMTWENQGEWGWHIDHRRPCASFDLTDPEQQLMCFHYTNLQPLWQSSYVAQEHGAEIDSGSGNLEKSDFFNSENFDWIWMGTEKGWIHKSEAIC